ncbi:TPA: transposase, partial [Legionella pneumophila]
MVVLCVLINMQQEHKAVRNIKHLDEVGVVFSTKIHAKVDAFGLPLGFILTGGQEHEIQVAKNLLNQEKSDYLLADRAYDS